MWKCHKCNIVNDDSARVCLSCAAARPRDDDGNSPPASARRRGGGDNEAASAEADGRGAAMGTGNTNAPSPLMKRRTSELRFLSPDRCRSAPFLMIVMALLVFVIFGLPFLVKTVNYRTDDRSSDVPAANPPGEPTTEYRTYDGYYNNPSHPDWGAAETTFLRRGPATFSDGVYLPREAPATANPRQLSLRTMAGRTGTGSYNNLTLLCVHYGQQVVEEILDAQRPGCPIEYVDIPLDADNDPNYKGAKAIPLQRNRYDQRTGRGPNNPRQYLNEISSFLDGGLIYGPAKAWADHLRSFKNGELARSAKWPRSGVSYDNWDPEVNTSHSFPAENEDKLPFANPPPPVNHYLREVGRFFKIGNPRGHENPMLFTFAVLWFREHNHQARRLRALHPDWDDEMLFQQARKWVIALHQHITINEWFPAFTQSTLPAYTGYDSEVHPGISILFQTAAMRFGHTLVAPGVFRRFANCTFMNTTASSGAEPGKPAVRTCNTFWNGNLYVTETDLDIEPWVMGMASQIAEREDNIITEDLRGFVFGSLDFSRRDLMAINIQRGREEGIQTYLNALRSFEGATIPTSFDELHSNATIVAALRELYGNDLEQVDVWVGGILDSGPSGPGQLFKLVLRDQYRRIRDGDRFWYANLDNGLFSASEVAEIEATRFSDIIIRNTGLTEADIQRDVFRFLPGSDPRATCPQPFQLSVEDLEPCTPLQSYDYWTGSEVVMWTALASLVFFAVVCVAWLYGTAGRHSAKVRAEQHVRTYIAQTSVQFLAPRRAQRMMSAGGADNDNGDDDDGGARMMAAGPHVRAVESAAIFGRRTAVYCRRAQVPEEALLLERPTNTSASASVATAAERTPSAGSSAGAMPGSSTGTEPLVLHCPVRVESIKAVYRYNSLDWEQVRGGSRASPTAARDNEIAGGVARQKVAIDYLIETEPETEPWVFLSVHPEDDGVFQRTVLAGIEAAGVTPQVWASRLAVYEDGRRTRAARQAMVDQFFEDAYKIAAQYRAETTPQAGRRRAQEEEEIDRRLAEDDAAAQQDLQKQGRNLADMIDLYVSESPQQQQRRQMVRAVRVNFAEFEAVIGTRDSEGNEYVRRLFEAARSCPLAEKAEGRTLVADGDHVAVSPTSTLSFDAFVAFVCEYTNRRQHVSIGALARIFSMELDNMPGAGAGSGSGSGSGARRGRQMDSARTKDAPVLVEQLERVLSSMLQLGGQKLDGASLRRVVDQMLRRSELSASSTKSLSRRQLSVALNLGGVDERDRVPDIDQPPSSSGAAVGSDAPAPARQRPAKGVSSYLRLWWHEQRGAIFVMSVFYLTEVFLFFSRFYDYGWLRENSGLRRSLGYGVMITRAAASEMMWAQAVILLTVSKNVLTLLRDSVVGRVIPFDLAPAFHRHVAYNFAFWSTVHTIGHLFNFYDITTQPAADLTCTFRNVFHSSDEIPHLDYWFFRTVTGITGYLLVLVCSMMFIFAVDWSSLFGARCCVRMPFREFQLSHYLWVPMYLLTLLHGSFALVQKPDFPYWLVGPLSVFLIDKFITETRTAAATTAYGTELPGSVVELQIEMPQRMVLESGQYVKLQIPEIDGTYHAFTITSSPSNKLWLSVHVRVVGRWTTRLADMVRLLNLHGGGIPRGVRVHVDGPYGEGHQNWIDYENAVLIGGGIGVTPFASILRDLQDRMKDGRLARSRVRRVYFVWVTPNLTQWRWLEEVVRDTAQLDSRLALELNRPPIFYGYIFVTRPQSVADRTGVADFNQLRSQLSSRVESILLSRRSGATLQRHERRPDMVNVLTNIRESIMRDPRSVSQLRANDSLVTGCFTCGPNRLVDGVAEAAQEINKDASLGHYYATFAQSF